MNCTKCGKPVNWTPHKVSGRLILTARCCGVGQTAEADFVVTAIREGLRQVPAPDSAIDRQR